ncbi:hypothetical protein SAMN05661096_03822 [Marivirga sericea]|uniref:Uncharacterized protein n=1 Tax=Marivirga sericea TaxID=1028 RepID=A0A1X7LEL8_9BACT|nr:hypothetical protein [Marivirga sericea]SMG51823.1 hypothetical protein SAMN05661096_03822 [Marivirga sericea]
MRLLELNIGGKQLEINRTFWGKETVLLDEHIVSQKRNIIGTSHKIEIAGQIYELKYIVKNAWKKLTGEPTIQINSEGELVSEHKINHKSFLRLQFFIGLVAMYATYLIVHKIVELAQNGFFLHEY